MFSMEFETLLNGHEKIEKGTQQLYEINQAPNIRKFVL